MCVSERSLNEASAKAIFYFICVTTAAIHYLRDSKIHGVKGVVTCMRALQPDVSFHCKERLDRKFRTGGGKRQTCVSSPILLIQE